jgi:hypothetical protein
MFGMTGSANVPVASTKKFAVIAPRLVRRRHIECAASQSAPCSSVPNRICGQTPPSCAQRRR